MSGKGSPDNPYTVLFLCTGNSARSVLAEAILNRVGAPAFKAYSAGSHPKGSVHPQAIALLKSLDYDTSAFRSKSWNEFAAPDAPPLDFIITVCDNAANEVCPVWPSRPIAAHWSIPDPASVKGSETEIAQAFRQAYQSMHSRIANLRALPLASLDRLSLQRMMAQTGNEQGD